MADAVATGGDGLADELGDLLFQSVFLAQLMEEHEGGADLADVARGQSEKLISRHPHVYGEAVADRRPGRGGRVGAAQAEEREERGAAGDELDVFYDLPVGLPALAYATKTQKRAAAVGFDFPDVDAALGKLREETSELEADPGRPRARRRAVRGGGRGAGGGRRSRAGAARHGDAIPGAGRAGDAPRGRGRAPVRRAPTRPAAAGGTRRRDGDRTNGRMARPRGARGDGRVADPAGDLRGATRPAATS